MKQGTAIIIGAGPAGLTAAIELQRQSGIEPIVLESSHAIGGISRTVRYKGNRMDIGGHRFFSKSDRVMRWWLDMMPVEAMAPDEAGGPQQGQLSYHGMQRDVPQPTSEPHLLFAPLLRLPHQPYGCHLPQSRTGAHLSLRRQLHALRAVAAARGKIS
jgi:protoporphyrinogen oxidase